MQLQITQTNLNRALTLLSRVASSRASLPVLANILIKTSTNQVSFSATNLEVAITHTTSAKIDNEGSVTIPARLFSDFVSQLPKDSVINLSIEGSKISIKADSYSSHIQGITAEDYPSLPVISNDSVIEVNAIEFKNALQRTIIAASHDDTRPVLSGVFMHCNKNNLLFAATDGYRLAEALVLSTQEKIEAIVPLQALQDTLRIIQDTDDEKIKLQFSDGQFGFIAGDTTLVSRLIDGRYPNYQQLIPENSEINFTVNRSQLLTATKLAGLFSRETGGSITIKADEVDGVSIGSVASQVGDNVSQLDAMVSGGGKVTVNVRYLTDALNCFDAKDINFRFGGSISPCVLTSKEQTGYQHIVMPLKS